MKRKRKPARKSKAGRKPECTEAELEKRVYDVMHARLDGAEWHDLRALRAERKWRVSDRTLWRYVEKSDELIAAHFEGDRAKLIVRHVAQRRKLFARAVQDGDLRTALSVAQDEAKLQGIYPGEVVKHAGHDGGPLPESKAVNVLDRIAGYAAALLALDDGPAPGDASGDGSGKPVDPVGADGATGPIPRPG